MTSFAVLETNVGSSRLSEGAIEVSLLHTILGVPGHASLVSQHTGDEGGTIVTAEPDLAPASTSAPGLALLSEHALTPPVGSPTPAAAAAASADEATAVAAADASVPEEATLRAPSPLLASPRLAEASAAADFAPVRERSPAPHIPVRAAAAATASAAIAAVNTAAAMAANANPSPQASTPRVSEVEDLALDLAPASPAATEAASNQVPEQPATPPAPASPPQSGGSTPIRHRVACTPVGAAAAATASAAVAAVVASAVVAAPVDACAVQAQPLPEAKDTAVVEAAAVEEQTSASPSRDEPSEQPPTSPAPPPSLEAGAQPLPEEDEPTATQPATEEDEPAATQPAATQLAATQSLDEFCSRVGEGGSPTQQAEPPPPSDTQTAPSEDDADALDEYGSMTSAAALPSAHVAVAAEEDSRPEDGEMEHEGQQARLLLQLHILAASYTCSLLHVSPCNQAEAVEEKIQPQVEGVEEGGVLEAVQETSEANVRDAEESQLISTVEKANANQVPADVLAAA